MAIDEHLERMRELSQSVGERNKRIHSDTKQAATCPSCRCRADEDYRGIDTDLGRCDDPIHPWSPAHPVSAGEPTRIRICLNCGYVGENFAPCGSCGSDAVGEWVKAIGFDAVEARAAELEEKLAATEKWGQEGWAWLDDALKALGVETVFDIPKHPQDEE